MNYQTGCVSIVDNGQGMAATEASSNGMGLRILKHRANLINGELHIDSTPEGTSVRCEFPLQEII